MADSDAEAIDAMTNMETWVLDHPEYGRIEVRSGFDKDFRALDPAWPGELPERFAENPDAGQVSVPRTMRNPGNACLNSEVIPLCASRC